MAIKRSNTIFPSTGGIGWVDQYETLVKGYTDFRCGCGSPIKVSYRKEFKASALYEFQIKHRNKHYAYSAKHPNELAVFDRMLKVSTYAKCDFAGKRVKKTSFR